MLNPFELLLDNPFNKYQLQLSFYQILLEQIECIKVSNRKIVWLVGDGEYRLYDVQDYTPILLEILENKNNI
jgi:hypothetical protein